MKLTPFGQVSRKLRIDSQMSLKEMAESLGITSSYLSAIEIGKKSLTRNLVDKYVEILSKNDNDRKELYEAADNTISKINIKLDDMNKNSRGLVIQFARKLDYLSNDDIKRIKKILNGNGEKYDNKK